MKRFILGVAFSLLFSSTLLAKWALIPLEELVKDSDLIVVGTLRSISEDSGEMSGATGEGSIVVEEVITRGIKTFEGQPLKPGDKLKLTWVENFACAMGMHRRAENEKLVWLLKIQNDGTVVADYPGRFTSLDDLTEIKKILRLGKTGKFDPKEVLVEEDNESFTTNSVELAPPDIVVNVAQNDNYSLVRALVVALFSFGFYLVLYRSRFSIR